MGTTAFIDLNFGYAAGAAMRISGMGGAAARPERSVVLSTNSVSNVAVTCRTPGNFTE
jgi:hypothetical protein